MCAKCASSTRVVVVIPKVPKLSIGVRVEAALSNIPWEVTFLTLCLSAPFLPFLELTKPKEAASRVMDRFPYTLLLWLIMVGGPVWPCPW